MKTRLNRLKIQLEFSDRSAQERKLSLMVRENDSKRELYLAKKKKQYNRNILKRKFANVTLAIASEILSTKDYFHLVLILFSL